MLQLFLRRLDEVWDNQNQEFRSIGGITVELIHTLYTVSKWEQKYRKPFARFKDISRKELLDYIMNFMCQTPDVNPVDWLVLTEDDINKIIDYMKDPGCATTIRRVPGQEENGGRRRETMTAEVIYYHMCQFNIPFECEHWHLNRLMLMLDVAAIKSSPPRKMGKKASAKYQSQLIKSRRAGGGM